MASESTRPTAMVGTRWFTASLAQIASIAIDGRERHGSTRGRQSRGKTARIAAMYDNDTSSVVYPDDAVLPSGKRIPLNMDYWTPWTTYDEEDDD